jgi:hypothetical protein
MSNESLQNLSVLIDYKCVPGSLNDLESNGQYNRTLSVLKKADKNFTTIIRDTIIKEQYIKHAIECCYKPFDDGVPFYKSKYKDLSRWLIENEIQNEQLMGFFFNSIDGVSRLKDISLLLLRFQRLSNILCMNSDILNTIEKQEKTLLDWYSGVFQSCSRALLIYRSQKRNSQLVIDRSFQKMKLLYNSVIQLSQDNHINIEKLRSNLSANTGPNLSANTNGSNLSANTNGSNQSAKYKILSAAYHPANRGGSFKEYIKLQKGGKRLIRYGGRGGRYYMKGGNKVYIK